jgi:type IV pilus assembly protein PilY1
VDLTSITNGTKRWGDPIDTKDADRIDDLWHASVNGHGNFVAAKNPGEFAQAMVDALATVAARLGSASNVTAELHLVHHRLAHLPGDLRLG